MINKLKPCKSCGGEPILKSNPYNPWGTGKPGERIYYYQCERCGFETLKACKLNSRNDTDEQAIAQALEYWQEQITFKDIHKRAIEKAKGVIHGTLYNGAMEGRPNF